MESVELQPRLPRPLLREPSPTYDTWKNDWPQYLSAYSLAFNAETYATQKAEADSTQNDDITSARVAGYFLLEFLNWRYILTTGPCDQLSKVLLPKSQEPDVVFNVVKWYRDRFIRLCVTACDAEDYAAWSNVLSSLLTSIQPKGQLYDGLVNEMRPMIVRLTPGRTANWHSTETSLDGPDLSSPVLCWTVETFIRDIEGQSIPSPRRRQ